MEQVWIARDHRVGRRARPGVGRAAWHGGGKDSWICKTRRCKVQRRAIGSRRVCGHEAEADLGMVAIIKLMHAKHAFTSAENTPAAWHSWIAQLSGRLDVRLAKPGPETDGDAGIDQIGDSDPL